MKKILGILIALMISTKAFASIAVMPTKIELNANKTKSNYLSSAVEIKGDSREIMRFKVYSGFFKIGADGGIIELPKGVDAHDITRKVKYVPAEFTVLPGRSQKLRINIIGVNTLAEGENRAVLYIEDVNPKEYNVDTGRANIGAQLIVKSRIAVPIYVDKGKFVKKAEIADFNLTGAKDGQYINAKILSTGNSRIRYQSRIVIFKDKKIMKEQTIPGSVIADASEKTIKQKVDTQGIEAGEYTLRYILTYTDEKGKKQNIKEETQIQIKGEM